MNVLTFGFVCFLITSSATTSTTCWDTGVDASLLRFVGAKSVAFPVDFNIHERLRRFHVEGRLKAVIDGEGIDWATAEAMAIGTLLLQVKSLTV